MWNIYRIWEEREHSQQSKTDYWDLLGTFWWYLVDLDHAISCPFMSCQAQGIAHCRSFSFVTESCDHVRRHGSRALGGNLANHRRPASPSHGSCHAGCSTIIRALVSSGLSAPVGPDFFSCGSSPKIKDAKPGKRIIPPCVSMSVLLFPNMWS